MEVIKTAIEGVVIIEPRIFKDARGYFFESFSQREFEEKVGKINFVQDNESMSSYGVMRGLHFQRPPYTQSKLVRCVRGLRTACGCRADRRQSPAVLHSAGLCPRFCGTERNSHLPVQVRQFLPSGSRRGNQYPGQEPEH